MTRYDLATPWQRFAEAFPWVIQQKEIRDSLITIVILIAITIYFATELRAKRNEENKKEQLLFLLFLATTLFFCAILAIFCKGDVQYFWEYGIEYGKYTYEEALHNSVRYYLLVERPNKYNTGISPWGAMLIVLGVGAIIDIKKKK